MSNNSPKSLVSGIYAMGEIIRDNIYFKNLKDTPTGYNEGMYLQATSTGIQYTDLSSSLENVLNPFNSIGGCAFLHLQSDSKDGDSIITDVSNKDHSILTNITHSEAIQPIFGSSSFYFNGSNGKLLAGEAGAWDFLHDKTLEQYTIQFWVHPKNINSTTQFLAGTTASTSDDGLSIVINESNQIECRIKNADESQTIVNHATALTQDTWHHIAITNDQLTLTVYIDGVAGDPLNWSSDPKLTSSSAFALGGGYLNSQAQYTECYIQDFRLDKYLISNSFFPPTQLLSTECTNLSQTSFSDLADTPSSYGQYGGAFVRVNNAENSLEYVDIGLSSSSSITFSTEYLNSNITGSEIVQDFQFPLVEGVTYRMSSTLSFRSDIDNHMQADFYDGESKLVSLYHSGRSTTLSNSMLFTAQSDQLFVSGLGLTEQSYLAGTPDISFVQLESLPALQVTLNKTPIDNSNNEVTTQIAEINATVTMLDVGNETILDPYVQQELDGVDISEIEMTITLDAGESQENLLE
jgi:hypothetical protein